ncbi:MAG: BrnT family toxin [Deltaproteobacteria bacterium]|nr:MAG: BrnT family toxin [Deltaproteobacteria bacterium]
MMRRTWSINRSTVDLRRRAPESEDRLVAIGAIERGIVVIAFTEPDEDTIRIISARRASKREQSLYRSYMDRKL